MQLQWLNNKWPQTNQTDVFQSLIFGKHFKQIHFHFTFLVFFWSILCPPLNTFKHIGDKETKWLLKLHIYKEAFQLQYKANEQKSLLHGPFQPFAGSAWSNHTSLFCILIESYQQCSFCSWKTLSLSSSIESREAGLLYSITDWQNKYRIFCTISHSS